MDVIILCAWRHDNWGFTSARQTGITIPRNAGIGTLQLWTTRTILSVKMDRENSLTSLGILLPCYGLVAGQNGNTAWLELLSRSHTSSVIILLMVQWVDAACFSGSVANNRVPTLSSLSSLSHRLKAWLWSVIVQWLHYYYCDDDCVVVVTHGNVEVG
jgi:hypothetical protein